MRFTRFTTVAALLTAALLAPAGAALAVTPSPAALTPPPKAAVPDTPYDVAARTGKRVEVEGARTPYKTSYANPDGTTTEEIAGAPVRVRQGSGWVKPDPTLTAGADGTLTPKASLVDVSLATGGSTQLATFRTGASTLHLSAPMKLTRPVVSGGQATYPEVLPGVDLVVTVSDEALSEVFVVKNARAAKNPALRKLTFPVQGSGLKVSRGRAGGVSVQDSTGLTVLTGNAPRMWDSTRATSSRLGGGAASARGPREAGRQHAMGFTATSSELTVTPDATALTSPDTTYPLYIDPDWQAGFVARAMVNKSYPSTSYLNWTGDEGMGYINDASQGTHTKRLFWTFDTSAMNVTGRRILDATFRVHETWAYTCTTVGVEAVLSSPVSTSTPPTWNNQPTLTTVKTTRTIPTYGRPDCTPGGADIDFGVKDQVANRVALGSAVTTIALKASSETSSTGWRRFDKTAVLTITYNTPPNMPSKVQMVASSGAAYKCGDSIPGGALPNMQVRASDPEGSKQQLKTTYMIRKPDGTTVYQKQTDAWQASGSTVRMPMPTTLANGTYNWIARSADNEPNGGALYGAWSASCAFTIDSSIPNPPLVWYQGGGWTTFTIGTSQPFLFNGGSTDTVSYRYGVNSDAPTSASIAPNVTVNIPLTTFGPFTLRVWGYDAAGNRSAATSWGGDDWIVSGGDALDWWRMDEASGSSANQKTASNPLTMTNAPGRTAGYPMAVGNSLLLNGTNQYGTGLGAAGPAGGDNFSLSAWGRPTTTTGRQVLLSQDVGAYASFTVAMETVAGPPDENGTAGPVLPRFVARLHTSTGATALSVVGKRPLVAGTWANAQLVVQRLESGALQLSLYTYVAGDSQDVEDTVTSTATTPAYVTSTASNSNMRVGVERKNSVGASFWNGAIDEVVTGKGVFDVTLRNKWRYPQ